MYLVHVRVLLPPQPLDTEEFRDFFRSHAFPGEGVEHVSVHGGTDGVLTVGFYVQADCLTAAECVALTVAERTLVREPVLQRASVAGGSGALVAEFYNRMVDVSARDGRSMRVQDQDSDRN